jgi:hypothetical protein
LAKKIREKKKEVDFFLDQKYLKID